MPAQDAVLRLILDTQALLRQLSDVVREWVASTGRMSRAADGIDFDLAQKEANELRQVVEQMAAGVVGNLAKIEAAGRKTAAGGLGAVSKESQQTQAAIARLTASAERELAKMERAARRVELQRLRKEAKDAEDAITRMTREADRELKKVEKAADRIQFRKAKEEARQVQAAIKTLEGSAARSFRAMEQRAEAAGLKLQTGIGGALTRLPPQVQTLQRRFEAAMTAMRNASDRVSFQKAQREAQRLEAAIHRMGQSATRDLDRIRQATTRTGTAFGTMGTIVGGLNRVLGSLGIFLSARVLLQWGKDAVQAAVNLEAFQAQLAASTKTTEEANELFQFANDQTERLGLNFASVVEGTARFAAATKNTNLTLEQRKEVLLSVFEASRVLNLSEQRLSNTLLALEQIASKATVSMEELRRQLGDNIPGAVAILADQMGVTQQQLLKMIETNQVLSTEALPLLAKGFRETFGSGVQTSIDTTAAKLGRLEKQLFDFRVAFAKGFEKELRKSVDDLADGFSKAEKEAEALGGGVAIVAEGIREELASTVTVIRAFRAAWLAFQQDIPESAARAILGLEGVQGEVRDLDVALSEAADASELANLEVALASVQQAFNKVAQSGSTLADLQFVNAKAHELLTSTLEVLLSRYQEEGKVVPEVLANAARALGVAEEAITGARTSAEKLAEAIKQANQAVESTTDPFSAAAKEAENYRDELLKLVSGVDLTTVSEEQAAALLQVANALKEASIRASEAKTALFGTEKAAEGLANKLRDLVQGLDLDRLTAEQAEIIRGLIEDVQEAFEKLGKEVPPDIIGIARELEALGFGLLGVREEVEKLTRELRQGLENVNLDNLNTQQLENLRDEVQKVLDAWAEYGERVPEDIQKVADKLGVVTTEVEKELKKQASEAEKAAKAEEQAAKRRVDALERIANSFLKLSETLKGTGGNVEVQALREELEDLEDLRFEGVFDSLAESEEIEDRIDAIKDRLNELEDSQIATGESAQQMADQIDDAIRGLIDQLEPVFARLSAVEQQSVESILTNLQELGISGVATGDDVANSLRSMINVLEGAGQPVGDLRSALTELETGSLDVGAAFDALREEIEQSFKELGNSVDGVEKVNEKLKKDVEIQTRLLAKLDKAYESTFNNIGKRMTVALDYWDKLNAACEAHKRCLSG